MFDEFLWSLVFTWGVCVGPEDDPDNNHTEVRTPYGEAASNRGLERTVAGVTEYVVLVAAGRSNLTDP